MIFRSQGGCGRQTAGSAGDDPEEEEVAGKEPRPESQEGCEVQGNIQDEKGLVKMSFNFSLYRLLTKPSAPTSSSVTRSLPRSIKIRRVTRPGTPCIDVTGQKTKSTVPKNLT